MKNEKPLVYDENIIEQVNLARTNPKIFSKKLEKLFNNYKGNILKIENCGLDTKEGIKGLVEAIAFMKTLHPTYPLTTHNLISNSTVIHVNSYIFNPGENEKNNLKYRLNVDGNAFGELFELINYGNISPFYVVANFIICDGDKKREARKILFSKNIKYISVSSGIVPETQRICVLINFVQYFYKFDETIPKNIYQEFENEIKENFNLIKEMKILTSSINPVIKLEFGDTLQSVSFPTIALNAEDFILSLTCRKRKNNEENYLNTEFKSKEELEDFFKENTVEKIEYDEDIDEGTIECLPEGIKKIIVRNTNDKILVRKKIYYTDGTIDSICYNK